MRERDINQMQNIIEDDFKDTPSYRDACLNSDSYIDIQVVDTLYPNIKTVLAYPGKSINVGDIFEFDNTYWLCFEADKINPVYESGKIYLCNNFLTINTPIPTNVPYVVYDNIALTRMGLDTNKGYILTPNSRMMIAVSNNDITKHIGRNDVYMLYDNDYYRVVDLNRARTPGLIVIEMDYYINSIQDTPLSPPSLPVPGYVIDGVDLLKTGQIMTYIAKKYVEIETIIVEDKEAKFKFSIIGDAPTSAYTLTSNKDDKSCTIKCNGFPHTIILQAEDKDTGETVNKQIKLISFL